ncbi:hypothetical protein [Deferribacter desulfuricans]|uniref:hypothetical protein n=1 Tax=Deferribacter desulfuricans TaxID=197162 RepID=UPI0002E4394B|nr:hypothetical protein [Deferribacter desulfuricans]
MGKSFNTNVKHNNKIYHVQTEINNGKVTICVFYNGMVVYRKDDNFKDYKTTLQLHKEVEDKIKLGQILKND